MILRWGFLALSSTPSILFLYFPLFYIFAQCSEWNFFHLLFQASYFCLNSSHFTLTHLWIKNVVFAPKSPFKLHLNLFKCTYFSVQIVMSPSAALFVAVFCVLCWILLSLVWTCCDSSWLLGPRWCCCWNILVGSSPQGEEVKWFLQKPPCCLRAGMTKPKFLPLCGISDLLETWHTHGGPSDFFLKSTHPFGPSSSQCLHFIMPASGQSLGARHLRSPHSRNLVPFHSMGTSWNLWPHFHFGTCRPQLDDSEEENILDLFDTEQKRVRFMLLSFQNPL